MNKIAISLWILLIVFYGSNGLLEDGSYTLNDVQTHYSGTEELNKIISNTDEPYLHKNGENYRITSKTNENIDFNVIEILIMIETLVDVKIMEDGSSITLRFATLEIAQKLCKHYELEVDLEKRETYNLLGVFQTDENNEPNEVMSKGEIWIDPRRPYSADNFKQYTIIQSDDDNLPHFIFGLKDFTILQLNDESGLSVSIKANGNEYKYILRFATRN